MTTDADHVYSSGASQFCSQLLTSLPAGNSLLPPERLNWFRPVRSFPAQTLLRITRLEPFDLMNCFFLKSANNRLTVSRVVPIISAISSCVSTKCRCREWFEFPRSADQPSSSLANFCPGELASPRVRISS